MTPTEERAKFGERLRLARLASCKTQVEVCQAAQISQSSLSQAEKGKIGFTRDVGNRIADLLSINILWLESGYGAPFQPLSLIQLNSCKGVENQAAAIKLVEVERPKFCIVDTQLKVVIMERTRGQYIILFGCTPFDPGVAAIAPYASMSFILPVYQIEFFKNLTNLENLFDETFRGGLTGIVFDRAVHMILQNLSLELPSNLPFESAIKKIEDKDLRAPIDYVFRKTIEEYKKLIIQLYDKLDTKRQS